MYSHLTQKMSSIPRERMISLSRWGLRIVWLSYTIFLFVMTHMTIPQPVAQVTSGIDKPLHLGAYFVLAALTAAVCVKSNPLRVSHALLFPVLMIYAAFDEILQAPFNRYPDVRDWIFDCIGILLGLFFIQVVIWLLSHPATPFKWSVTTQAAGTSADSARGYAR